MLKTRFRAILASPLLHFFVLGGLVFGYYSLKNPASEQPPTDDVLRLSETDAQRLVVDFFTTWHRAPTREELRGQIRDWAIEEASVREALALGLDQGDAMIRNRLRNKVEFLAEAPAAALTPDEATLAAYYRANAARFSHDGELSFAQVLLPANAGPDEVEAVKAELEQGADPGALSNSSMLPPQVEGMAAPAVERLFGKGFGKEVAGLPLDRWSGPLQSGYGAHLVRLEKRLEGVLPPLSQVRERVLGEWRADEARKLREDYTANLLQRYRLELPEIPDEVRQ
ncbi:peptidylprolyl isomerase [Paracoccus sp. MBLB3053]|uniref:peptidylprolyl isomerase n=1 Tax=Paracoccus aurantius TaxID=3073814 RepID=A0ABU2HS78_9RHOB|nr:peptidylprolyl isomerase [Paracoccus sp. MBLB3053]MDS9467906.1 peptidylprolyl isomerase [Paracoccus sp. MBLB3053]